MYIAAKYENGVFKPLEEVHVEEGTVVMIRVPQPKCPKPRPRSVREYAAFGMWADRDDIVDGVSYVNKLRGHPDE